MSNTDIGNPEQSVEQYHQIFRYLHDIEGVAPQFKPDYLKRLSRVERSAEFLLTKVLSALWPYKRKRSKFVFFSGKYRYLLSLLPRESVALVSDFIPFRTLVDVRVPYMTSLGYSRALFGLYQSDPLLISAESGELIEKGVTWFNEVGPEYFIVPNDSLFTERFMIYCAKQAGVKTICIQHGLFQKQTPVVRLDGFVADHMLVWGENIKRLYAGTQVEKKLVTFAYPFDLRRVEKVERRNKTRVCILGQPWESYNKSLGELKFNIFSEVFARLPLDSYQIDYKPHPWESDLRPLGEGMGYFSGDMARAIKEYDVFISLTSTALLEASLAGKVALQIYHPAFECDKFDVEGFCHRVDAEKLADLADFLVGAKAYSVPLDAINQVENLGEYFIQTLRNL